MKKWMAFSALLSILVSAIVWLYLDARFIALQTIPSRGEEVAPTESTDSENDILTRQVMNTEISAEARASLEEKIELSTNLNEQMSNPPVPPAEKVAPEFSSLLATGGETEPIETGIFPGSDGMVKPEQANVNNYWQGQVGDEDVFVFAGSPPEDENVGRVVCMKFKAGDPLASPEVAILDTAGKNGPLRVQDASGGTVTLQAADGSTYLFDPAVPSFK